jgi:hypothetical protein
VGQLAEQHRHDFGILNLLAKQKVSSSKLAEHHPETLMGAEVIWLVGSVVEEIRTSSNWLR